jgi:hypothetical protein
MIQIRSRWLVAASTVALLAACGKSDHSPASPTASTTPAKTVLTTVQLFKQGDFDGLMKHILPPDQYKRMRAEWKSKRADIKHISDADRQKFAKGMAQLTAPDAEQKLWARVQPKLAQASKKYKAQVPLMVGMGQVMMDTKISNSKQLTADQKKQATNVVDAVGGWAQKAEWTNPDKLKQAIGVVTDTARKLDIKTLDQAVKMNYDQAMKRYTTGWNGIKRILGIYGLSVDKTLDSATAKTLSSDAHTAKVRVDYTLLGKPQQLTVDLIKIDGRWYDKDLLDHWRKALEQDSQPGTAASAPASAKSAPAAQSAASAH